MDEARRRSGNNERLARRLVLDELFDLTFYKRLREKAPPHLHALLDELIEGEARHVEFWKDFFSFYPKGLGLLRRIKLSAFILFVSVFGERGIHLLIESIEIYGIRKYLRAWDLYKHNENVHIALKEILTDEFRHEDAIVSLESRRKIHPERIRDIFLGFNDGLVEILGAVSGFFAAFQSVSSVIAASFTVAVAGSISMAAGAYVAMGSEKEIEDTETERKRFLGEYIDVDKGARPFMSAIVVGISYFIGALVPVTPVLFGTQNIIASVISATIFILLISYIFAFLSGMNTLRRIAINLAIIAIAVSVTYGIGIIAKNTLGIAI